MDKKILRAYKSELVFVLDTESIIVDDIKVSVLLSPPLWIVGIIFYTY